MSGVAIVALPSEDDYVNRLSSVQIPHLTLLFLGEEIDDLSEIVRFVEHASGSLSRFGLDVDKRGVLGDKSADVLFFKKGRMLRDIETFRSQLLKNDNINKAYLSTPQFDSWTPHLTMGYPETPALPDTREYPGTHWVNFDRIAVWTGEFDGPVFDLQDDEMCEEVAMSDAGKTFIGMVFEAEGDVKQYGKKGMKWGVRNDKGHEGERAKTKTIAKLDKKYDKSLQGIQGFVKVNNAVAARINPKLDKLNAKPEYSNIDMTKPEHAATHKKYIDEYRSALEQSLNEAMSDIGTNASGTQRIHLTMVGEGLDTSYEGYTEVLKHADAFDKFLVVPKFNRMGQITGQEIKPDGVILAHIETAEDFMAHYGVLGMKWGKSRTPAELAAASAVREKTKASRRGSQDIRVQNKHGGRVLTKGGKRNVATEDAVKAAVARQKAKSSSTNALTNKELKDTIERMRLEEQYTKLAKNHAKQTRGERFMNMMLGNKDIASTTTVPSSTKELANT